MVKVIKVLFVIILGCLTINLYSIYAAESNTDTVSVSIQGGSLSLALPKSPPKMTFQQETKSFIGSLGEVGIMDATGSGFGWHVNVIATRVIERFKNGEEKFLPEGSLFLNKFGTKITTNGGKLPHLYEKNIFTLDQNNPQTILIAYETEGMGKVNLTFPNDSLKLYVPTYEEGNQYITSIYFSIIQGP